MAQQESTAQLTAVHIDYANRPESTAEAASLWEATANSWVLAQICRRIEKSRGGETARDEYEQVALHGTVRLLPTDGSRLSVKATTITGIQVKLQPWKWASLGTSPWRFERKMPRMRTRATGSPERHDSRLARNYCVSLYRPLPPLERVLSLTTRTDLRPIFQGTRRRTGQLLGGKLRNKLIPHEIYGEGSMNNLATYG
jgi:hypothetical protein